MILDSNEKIYYSYLINNGFNPFKYGRILEVGTNEKKAISKEIIGADTFLLSEDLDYSKMVDLGLFGARGYIDNYGINIPKTIETDSFMRYHGMPVLRKGGIVSNPTLEDFDAILCPALYERLFYMLKIKKDIYIGSCMDCYDPRLKRARINLEHFKIIVQNMYGINMVYSRDTFDRGMKEIQLLKKNW